MPACTPGTKKKAKRVKNCNNKYVCVRYGSKDMSIKKHIPSRKKSFCARHKCYKKTDPATPGYQSCKAWNCKTGRACSNTRRRTNTRRRPNKTYVSKSGRKYTNCWSGYKRSGWKTKNGRRVPNCVKI